MTDWPPSTRPWRSSPPEGSVGVVLPIRNDMRFFKLCYYSVLDFTDHRFMLTIVDNMCDLKSRQYVESIKKNHNINVLTYHKDNNLASIWNLGLRFMFSFSSVKYGVVMTPTFILEPYWLSRIVRSLDADENVGVIAPSSNGVNMQDAFLAFRRSFYEDAGGFDEELYERHGEIDFMDKNAAAKVKRLRTPDVYVHKFRLNGFDPRREAPREAIAQEKQEANS
jgi:hypothetical protein